MNVRAILIEHLEDLINSGDAHEIVETYLEDVGATGLCSDECGCGDDYLFACGEEFLDCEPARKRPATEEDCDLCCDLSPGCDFWERIEEAKD